MIKLYSEEHSDRNTLLCLRYYKVLDMEDICIQDFNHWLELKYYAFNRKRGYLNPDTTVDAMKKQMVMYDD